MQKKKTKRFRDLPIFSLELNDQCASTILRHHKISDLRVSSLGTYDSIRVCWDKETAEVEGRVGVGAGTILAGFKKSNTEAAVKEKKKINQVCSCCAKDWGWVNFKNASSEKYS